MDNPAVDQAAPKAESLIDRLAKEFEQPAEPDEPTKPDVAAAETADDEQESDDGMEDVEYEGQSYRVPKPLKEAFIHKADYTSKTQEVATARRNVELLQETMKAAHAEQAFTASIATELNQQAATEAKRQDLLNRWAMLSTDEKQEVYLLDNQLQSLAKSIGDKRGEFNARQVQVVNDLKAKAREATKKSIPNFTEKVAEEIASHAFEEGYTKQEIDAIWDPRHAKTLWKAMQFDKLQKAAIKAPAKAPAIKPGASNTMPQDVKQKLNFGKAMKGAKTSSEKAKLITADLAASFR